MGLLDTAVEMDAAAAAWSDVSTKLAGYVRHLDRKMNATTHRIGQEAQKLRRERKDSGKRKRRRRLVELVAAYVKELDRFADDCGAEIIPLRETGAAVLGSFGDFARSVREEGSEEKVEQMKKVLRETVRQIAVGATLRQFAEVLDVTARKNVSDAMTRSTRRVMEVVELVANEIEEVAAGLLALLDDEEATTD